MEEQLVKQLVYRDALVRGRNPLVGEDILATLLQEPARRRVRLTRWLAALHAVDRVGNPPALPSREDASITLMTCSRDSSTVYLVPGEPCDDSYRGSLL